MKPQITEIFSNYDSVPVTRLREKFKHWAGASVNLFSIFSLCSEKLLVVSLIQWRDATLRSLFVKCIFMEHLKLSNSKGVPTARLATLNA